MSLIRKDLKNGVIVADGDFDEVARRAAIAVDAHLAKVEIRAERHHIAIEELVEIEALQSPSALASFREMHEKHLQTCTRCSSLMKLAERDFRAP